MSEKVVSLAEAAKKKKDDSEETQEENLSFEEIMRRNADNAARMKKEREKANRNVIRSYRLKPR